MGHLPADGSNMFAREITSNTALRAFLDSGARVNTKPNWANCPSTHCERSQECRSPSDCTVRTTGRKALIAVFRTHVEAMNGGPLPDWPEDSWRWDERYGGLPYMTVIANRFRDFMAGFDAALASAAGDHPAKAGSEGEAEAPGGTLKSLAAKDPS